jgi:diaminohydroxyphosphoribosylaminopyrimidine deaminase/5-amino-6-(5-phosphoribosylamino)uracil reductase
MVGALVLRGRHVIGEGWHTRAGEPHAEAEAIRDARRKGDRVAGATLVVTLEPCSTQGRTPPCTDLILRERIARIIVGTVDPNPKHAGRGLDLLQSAGVEVVAGIEAEACAELNAAWNHWIVTGRSWVLAKMALSIDGRIAAPEEGRRWVTGPAARVAAHEMRLDADAIIIGAETARTDDPLLTVRLPRGHPLAAAARRKPQPWRVVWTRHGRLPSHLRLLTDKHRERTWVATGLALEEILKELSRRGCVQILLEGGGRLLGEAFHLGLANEAAFFIHPAIFGRGPLAVTLPPRSNIPRIQLEHPTIAPCGADWLVRGRVPS